MLILIGGGSRSGKSRFALEYALRFAQPRVFIATAEALDEEMRVRAGSHRAERGTEFRTIEEPLELSGALQHSRGSATVIVIDCLTLWLSNLMLAGRDPETEAVMLVEAALELDATVLAVTNEVGCGIVPDNALARQFRDAAGKLNSRIAGAAQEVYWMIFGQPLRIR